MQNFTSHIKGGGRWWSAALPAPGAARRVKWRPRLSEGEHHPHPAPAGVEALLRLYTERRDNLVRFFTGRLRSAAEAEDLIQDLYLKIAGLDAETMSGEVSSALLFRIANNLMIDRLRSRQRSAVRDQAWQRGQVMEVAGAPVVDAPGADEVVASRQRLNALVEAVSSLPPQTARAFRMHKLEGLSHAETAAAMGVSKSAVEKHISAAMKLLIKKMQ